MDGSLLCRICIAADTDVIMISIFGEDGLYQKIKSFANVDIEEGDSLPQQICMMCARNVLNACSFKRKCEESDRIYRNQLLHKPPNKVTNDSSKETNEVKENSKEVIDLNESESDEEDEENDDDDDEEDDDDDDEDEDEEDDDDDDEIEKNNGKYDKKVNFTGEIDKVDLSNPKYSDDNEDKNMELTNEWNSHSQNTTDDDQLPLIPEIELITPNEEVKVSESHFQGYQCSICFQIFNMRATLNHHIKTFHPESSPSFECFNCRKQYLSKRFLEKHIRRGRCVRKRKNTTRPMRCSGCSVIFPTGHHLGWHKRTGCPSKMSAEDQKKMNVTHMSNLMYRENVLKKMYNFNKFRKPRQKGRSRIKLDALTISYAKQLIAQDATTSKMAQELNISRTFAWRLRKSLLSGTNLHSQNGGVTFNDIQNKNNLDPSEKIKQSNSTETKLQQLKKNENDNYLERIANNNSLEMTMITSSKELLQNSNLSEEQIQIIKDKNFKISQNSEIRFIPIVPKTRYDLENVLLKSKNYNFAEQEMQQIQLPKISVVSEKVLKGQNDINSLQKRIENVTNVNQQFGIKSDLDNGNSEEDDDESDDVQIDETFHGPQPSCSSNNNLDSFNKIMRKFTKMLAKGSPENEESSLFDPKLPLQQNFHQFSNERSNKKPRKQNVFLDEDKYEKAKILVANHATTLEIARALDVSQMSAWKLRDSILKGIPLQFRKSTTHIPQKTSLIQMQNQLQLPQQQKLPQQQQQNQEQDIQIKIEDLQHTQQQAHISNSSNSSIQTTNLKMTSSSSSTNQLQNGIKIGGRGRVKASVKIERDKQITEIILDYIRADPGIQYWKITEKLAEKGFVISTSSICQKLKALGFHRRSKGTTTKPELTDNNLNKTVNASDDNSGSDLFGAHFLGSTFSD